MATKAEINLIEGTQHNVVFTIPNEINLALYTAKIQVKDKESSTVNLFEFSTTDSTLTKHITTVNSVLVQQLLLTIPASITENKDGVYKYQLMLWTGANDVIKFGVENFVIKPSITQF